MNRQQKSDKSSASGAPNPPSDGASVPRKPDGSTSKLPFFRMILWIAVYCAAALFLMSLILLGTHHIQTQVIGGALFAAVALVVATYVLDWRR